MPQNNSMFLFEIIVEELTSFINCREFCIKSQFADVFNIDLNDPNELQNNTNSWPKRHGKSKAKRQTKTRSTKNSDKFSAVAKVQTGQSILFEDNVENLISNMKQYPMELSLWSKIAPDYKIGSTQIPWSALYYEYLNKIHRKEPQPVCVKRDYNVFDETTSKRIAVVKLNVKLCYLQDIITPQFEFVPQEIQKTANSTQLNSKPNSVLVSRIKARPINLAEETGTIKTIYNGAKHKGKRFRDKNKNIKKEEVKAEEEEHGRQNVSELESTDAKSNMYSRRLNNGLDTLVQSGTNLKKKCSTVIKFRSCSSINQENNKMLNYIFGGKPTGPFGNQVYCVRYFTVENDFANSPKSGETRKDSSEESESPNSERSQAKEKYTFKKCHSECLARTACSISVCSIDLPKEASEIITVKKCDQLVCDNKEMRKVPTPPDDRILLDLSTRRKDCCNVTEKVEEVVGGIKAMMKFGRDPCYCECECKFGFMKKTTYCGICGGYEDFGEELSKIPTSELPFPCPVFHQLVDKNKMKMSTSGSDTKRDRKEISESKKEKKETSEPKKEKKEISESKKEKKETSESKKGKKETSESKRGKKEAGESKPDKIQLSPSDSEKDLIKKGKRTKKEIDSRFKFNYGYTGIPPHIGHSRCLIPCGGGGKHTIGHSTVGNVPKSMGWLWNAENVPGLKFRPSWRPGATNKHVVRLLKIAKDPAVMHKKKKKDTGKVKKPLKRPLLIVQKVDGEYTVTMETMKTYNKPRNFNQQPYEDKPLVTYTIGRTSEENLERKKKKERKQRRLERLQRDFVQSAFRDMCQEICLKTYQQALGILPNAEDPNCDCYPAEPDPEKVDLDHSCSCSEDKDLTGSDTDSDEWIVEFTPPNATYDPTFKSKKIITVNNSTQYTYMDYRVKLLDRYGNQVPRYFKGPDGKQECSDLGGFWGPDHKWLEINVDGFVGPDGKWAPHTFTGPNGELVDGETGKFQAMDGKWLVIGVDGYVDKGKWKAYSKPRDPKKSRFTRKKPVGKIDENEEMKPSNATWSCFGSVTPKQLSKLGIVGHGQDKKLLLSTLQDMLAHGEDVKIPEPIAVPPSNKPKPKRGPSQTRGFVDSRKCKHAKPSEKGIVAVDGLGNKTYFKLKDFNNRRPRYRVASLVDQGISLSSFHVPCFDSFISCEMMKKQQYDRLVALAERAKGGEGYAEEGHPKSGGGRKIRRIQRKPLDKNANTGTQAQYTYVV